MELVPGGHVGRLGEFGAYKFLHATISNSTRMPSIKTTFSPELVDAFRDLFPYILQYLDCEAMRKFASVNRDFRNRSYSALALAEFTETSGKIMCKLNGMMKQKCLISRKG